MKIGNLKVFDCCGLAKPTLGPIWYIGWLPMCACYALLGGVLFYMTWFIPDKGPLVYAAWALIAMESIMYWTLCFSHPGIPPRIMQRAREISNGETLEETKDADDIIREVGADAESNMRSDARPTATTT